VTSIPRWLRLSLATVFVALAVWQLGGGAAIHLKAVLAQQLLQRAWARTQDGEVSVRPWPGADTWPVARLVVDDEGVDQIVLAGATGSSLAFGPGHVDGTAAPGVRGNVVIGGHRDTHFRFLAELERGDRLWIEDAGGTPHRYRVTDLRVVDHRDSGVLVDTALPTLTLVTCYPFDAVVPGGPLRYVVTAVEEGALCEKGVNDRSGCG